MAEKKMSGLDKLSRRKKLGFVTGSIKGSARKIVDRSVKPKRLVNIVTWKCNGNCTMCNISRMQDPAKEITLGEYEEMLKDKEFWSSLKSMNVTGGEPFMRKDLLDLIFLFQEKCKNLERVDIATNGFLTEKIVQSVKELLREGRTDIGVSVSLDGIYEMHDKIRGVKGAFEKTSATIRALRKLEKEHDNLILTTQCVVSRINIGHLKKLDEFCRKNGVPSSLSIASFQDSYYKNTDKRHLGLTGEEVKRIFNRAHFIDYYIHKQVDKKKRYLPCDSGFGTFSINPDGDVYFCNNLTKVGNVRENRIRDIWNSEKADKVRSFIKKGDVCRECFFSCDLASAVQENFPLMVKFGVVHYLLKKGVLKLK